jgi:iron complex transport system substrate-binding protein
MKESARRGSPQIAEAANPTASEAHPDASRQHAGPIPRRTLLKGVAALGGSALLGACGGGGSGASGGAGNSGGNKQPAVTRPRGITVTDQRGKTLVFDKPVTRVVTIPIPAASMLIAVDKTADHVVGMNDASWVAIKEGIMGQMFPAALKAPHNVANEEFAPNVESIAALNPDVVVQWGDQGSAIITPLENAGLKVLGLSYGTQQDLDVWITLFATMLGKVSRGREIIAGMTGDLKHMRSLAPTVKTPPSIVYFLQMTSGLEVAGKDTYNDFYIKLIGATNPASGPSGVDSFATVDAEQVLAWDPDIMLIGNFDTPVPRDVYSDPVWRHTKAVRSKRVYKVPLGGYRWDPPSQESPLMWQWLSHIAFPSGSDAALRQQIVASYQFLYGYHPSNAQIDKILWTDANAGSANYRQFHAA